MMLLLFVFFLQNIRVLEIDEFLSEIIKSCFSIQKFRDNVENVQRKSFFVVRCS